MGAFDALINPALPPASTLDAIMAAHAESERRANTPVESGSLLPLTKFADDHVGFDPHAGVLGSLIGLPRQAFGAANDYTAARALGDDAGAADAAGTMAQVAGNVGLAGAPIPRPAGSLGMFGGAAAHDVPGMFGGDVAFQASPGFLDRAISQTRGMVPADILGSDKLWHHAGLAADAGVSEEGAFADLANRLFAAHGIDKSLTPEMAGQVMAGQREAASAPMPWNERAMNYLRASKADHLEQATDPYGEGVDYANLHAGIARGLADVKAGGPGYALSEDANSAVAHHFGRATEAHTSTGRYAPRDDVMARIAEATSGEAPSYGSIEHPSMASHAIMAGMDPETFANTMFGDGHTLRGVRGDDSSLHLSATLPNGSDVIRNFNADGSVDHSFFQVPRGAQDAGTAKALLAQQIPLYQQMGRTQVNVHANIDVGGYAWGRYGFVPDRSSWQNLRSVAHEKLDGLDGQIPAEAMADLRAAANSKDPKSFWDLVDDATPVPYQDGSVPMGKHLFLGSNWHGTLNLSDPQVMERFNRYVSR